MIFLLDTGVLLDTLRARQNRRNLLADQVLKGHTLSTTPINIAEIYACMRPSEREQTEIFLAQLQCFPVTPQIGRLAGSLKNQYARQGKILELPDMLIAATALEHNLLLMTDSRKDFPIPELNFHPLPQ